MSQLPDFEAKASSVGSRDSVPGSDIDAPVKSGRLNVRLLVVLVAAATVVKFAFLGLGVETTMSLSVPNAENWQDFALAYMPAAFAFRSGFLPYIDFNFAYPPLFLYALTAFSYLPLPSWSGSIPLVAADALTVVPVYLIARRVWGERSSLLISALFILAPTNLYYVDYLWLNPSLTTLLLLISVYFMIEGRYAWSAFILALSIGFKQTALFALPVFLFIIWRRRVGRFQPVKYLLVVAGVCLALSLPYIVVRPTLYLDSILRVPLNTFSYVQLPDNYYQIASGTGTQVTFNTSNWLTSRWALLSPGVYGPATLALPVFIFLAPTASYWLYTNSSLLSVVGYLAIAVGFVLLLWRVWRRKTIEQADILRYVLYAMLFVFTFYPLYKYYVVGMVPLLVLLVRSRRDAVGFLAFSLAFMLVPRYLASWALLVGLIWLLRDDLRMHSLRETEQHSVHSSRPEVPG